MIHTYTLSDSEASDAAPTNARKRLEWAYNVVLGVLPNRYQSATKNRPLPDRLRHDEKANRHPLGASAVPRRRATVPAMVARDPAYAGRRRHRGQAGRVVVTRAGCGNCAIRARAGQRQTVRRLRYTRRLYSEPVKTLFHASV